MSPGGAMTVKRLILHILVGQAVAFLNSITGVSTTMLVNNDASFPLLQSITSYAFIFIVYGPLFLFMFYRHGKRKFANFTFLMYPWKYAILALVDLEANFVIVKAYQYTDMMSVQLLSCFAIPCVLVLSFFILKMRFTVTHVLGCVVATGGLAFLIALDADGVSRDGVGPSVVKGDLLCLLASALYATSNVLTEWFIKPTAKTEQTADSEPVHHMQDGVNNNDEVEVISTGATMKPSETKANETDALAPHKTRQEGQMEEFFEEYLMDVPKYIPVIENLCFVSGFALIFAVIQFFAAEWKSFAPKRATWTGQDWLFQIVFGLTMLCFYTGLPTLFLLTSAAFANISLLAVNIYSIIWNVTVFHVHPKPIFFVSYVIIVVGTVVYDLSDIQWSWCPRCNYPCGDPRESNEVMDSGRAINNDEQQQQQQKREEKGEDIERER